MTPVQPSRRKLDATLYGVRRIPGIILHADIAFGCVVLGFGMILWGLIGLFHQTDLVWFANGFALEVAPWLWGINHIAVGIGFIHVAVHHFPKGRCLCLGTYAVFVWSWIAMSRPSSSLSSGVTLNFIIILMGMLIVQRSGNTR